MVENGFFEHLGLIGGFLLVAWHDLTVSERPSAEPDSRIIGIART